jgi:glycosyltransferase involved in cell wall biosynthesis
MKGAVWHYVDSSQPGGIETHLAALLPALRAMGVHTELMLHADYGPHPLRDALDAAGVPHRSLGGFTALHRALRADRPAILHTHGYKAGLLGRLARLLGGPPVVSTMHSGGIAHGKVAVYEALDRATAPLAKLIAVSRPLAERHPAATFIPNGIALPPEPPAPGEAIAFVGRLSEEKGPVAFARLAARFGPSRPDLRFVAFGDGPLRTEAEAAACGHVQFRGSVPDMEPHWVEVGLLVMPSRFEGLPMAALEAMARGIPVAAHAVGALPGLVAEGRGWCVPPGDGEAFAAAVAAWAGLDRGTRQALAARNRAHVAAAHAVADTARATADVYAAVLRG